MHFTLKYGDNQLRVEDIQAVREEGVFRGSILHDFAKEQFVVAARSSTAPLAAARFLRPSFEFWLKPCLSARPTRFDGEARIGYETNDTLEIHAGIEGKEVGYRSFVADRGSRRIDVSDGRGELHLRNSNMFDTRLGKGLARYLSKLHPSLGPNTRQKVDLSYAIEGQTIRVRSLEMKGRFSTITGKGHCTLDGKLDLRIQAKLFGKNLP